MAHGRASRSAAGCPMARARMAGGTGRATGPARRLGRSPALAAQAAR